MGPVCLAETAGGLCLLNLGACGLQPVIQAVLFGPYLPAAASKVQTWKLLSGGTKCQEDHITWL